MVEDSLSTESLDVLHRESRRDIKEMRSAFRDSKSFLLGFWAKSLLKLVTSLLFLAWLLWGSQDKMWTSDGGLSYVNYLNCTLDGVDLTCIIPHTHFYIAILGFVCVLTLMYAAAAIYTILWLLFPRMRKLGSHLREYRRSIGRAAKVWLEESEAEARMDVYGGLHSPDVELLLDLLAETEGIAPAMRILTLLDQEFHMSWRTHQLQQVRTDP